MVVWWRHMAPVILISIGSGNTIGSGNIWTSDVLLTNKPGDHLYSIQKQNKTSLIQNVHFTYRLQNGDHFVVVLVCQRVSVIQKQAETAKWCCFDPWKQASNFRPKMTTSYAASEESSSKWHPFCFSDKIFDEKSKYQIILKLVPCA